MSLSVQTLIDKFKIVVFEKFELECPYTSTLLEFLLTLDSKCYVRNEISDFLGLNSLLQLKVYQLTRRKKNEEGGVEEK